MNITLRIARGWRIALVGLLMISLLMIGGASAYAEAPLRWKFKVGEDLNYVMDRTLEGKINFSGADIAFMLKMVFDSTWKTKAIAKDGTAEVEQTIDRVQVNMNSPLGGAVEFDSQLPDQKAGLLQPMVDGMLGQTVKMKVSPLGKVTDIELPKKLIDALGGGQQGGRRQAGMGIGGNLFSEQGVKELIEKSVMPLPETAGKDSVWKQAFKNEIPGIGTQTSETTYSLAGSETLNGKKVNKITTKTELTFEPAEDPRGDLEITAQEGASTILFDQESGRMLRSEGKQTTAIELSGPQEITQEMSDTVVSYFGKSESKSADAKKDEKKNEK